MLAVPVGIVVDPRPIVSSTPSNPGTSRPLSDVAVGRCAAVLELKSLP